MGIFEGPFLFFWLFAGAVAIAYHAYFFWESVIKVDAPPKEIPEDPPENLIRFPGTRPQADENYEETADHPTPET